MELKFGMLPLSLKKMENSEMIAAVGRHMDRITKYSHVKDLKLQIWNTVSKYISSAPKVKNLSTDLKREPTIFILGTFSSGMVSSKNSISSDVNESFIKYNTS